MPRTRRILIHDTPTTYHVMSRTALDGYPISGAENDYLLRVIKRFSALYFAEVLGFCLMGNHFHLLVRMLPADTFNDGQVLERYRLVFGENAHLSDEQMRAQREKWSSLSEYMREIKQTFSRFYNKRHNRRGFFWGERFKSVIVEDGRTLVNCLAYIDLNPIRAGIAKRPEEYRWCSMGYHAQTNNQDDFLSLDFGLVDWDVESPAERQRLYREFLYETGALDNGKGRCMEHRIVQRAQDAKFEYTHADRLTMRTRWFTDSAIIGGREFVGGLCKVFKLSKSENYSPHKVPGLTEVYSLRRLAEML